MTQVLWELKFSRGAPHLREHATDWGLGRGMQCQWQRGESSKKGREAEAGRGRKREGKRNEKEGEVEEGGTPWHILHSVLLAVHGLRGERELRWCRAQISEQINDDPSRAHTHTSFSKHFLPLSTIPRHKSANLKKKAPNSWTYADSLVRVRTELNEPLPVARSQALVDGLGSGWDGRGNGEEANWRWKDESEGIRDELSNQILTELIERRKRKGGIRTRGNRGTEVRK
ncbi:hypothetical protein B0H13DRAFT_1883054 [Mycena leptocephala]|nr:hypothetical protein B0H13DRAFT_1883054 [Mycena leptocephala]